MDRAGIFTAIFSGIIYGFCGLIGVLAYPTNTQENVMLNFEPDLTIDILLISMAIAVLFGYPVTSFVAREMIDGLLFPHSDQIPYIRFTIEAIVIIGVSFTIAVFVPSFTTILGLFGSLTKVAICQIFPALFYLRLGKGDWKIDRKKWGALFLMVAGGIIGMISTVVTIINYINKQQPPNMA